MPLYRTGQTMPQAAQGAASSAINAASSQTRETKTVRENETSFWDDLAKGASAIGNVANAANALGGALSNGMAMYDNLKVKSAYDDIAKAFGQGGYEAIQNNPDMQGFHHAKALGQFVLDRANSEKGRLEIMQKSAEASDRLYQDWRLLAMKVNEAWDKGDIDNFNQGMVNLMEKAPMPYRIKADGRGGFRELFRSDRDGGWVETGRTISSEDAIAQMRAILKGEQMVLRGADMKAYPLNRDFQMAALRNQWGTMLGNAQNRVDPQRQIQLYDRNGEVAGLGVIQNPLDDYWRGPEIHVYGKDGKNLGVFDGWEGALRQGYSPFRPAVGASKRGRAGASGLPKTVIDPEEGEVNTDDVRAFMGLGG